MKFRIFLGVILVSCYIYLTCREEIPLMGKLLKNLFLILIGKKDF